MRALPPPIAEKCAKAIGQLASPHEGQVMAGARGLLRILEGAGLGITDLSDHITAPPREIVKYIHKPQDPPHAGPRDYGDWRKTWAGYDPRRQHKARVDLLTSDQTGFLTDWEFTFTLGPRGETFAETLRRAETDPDQLKPALHQLDALAALDRRTVLASFAALHRPAV